MKFHFRTILVLLLSNICISASAQKLVPCNTVDAGTKVKQWGFCDCFYAGIVVKCQYDTTFAFTEGLGRVKQNDKYGFVNGSGKLVIPVKYDAADAFSEGFAAVALNGRVSFIDKKGMDNFKKDFKTAAAFSNGLALCSNDDGKRGFIDTKGNIAVPFALEAAYSFNNKLAPVRFNGEKIWKAINTKGEVVFTFPDKVKSVMGGFSDGLAMVYVDGPAGYNVHYDFVNEKGEFVCDAPYASASPFKNGRAIIANENKNRKSGDLQFFKYGLIKTGGSEIVPAQYPCLEESPVPGIYFYGSTSASLSNCSGYGLLDSNGKVLTQAVYSSFTRLNDTTFLCREAGSGTLKQYLLLTTKGKELLSVKKYEKRFYIAGTDTLLVLTDDYGETVSQTIYNIHSGILKENASKGFTIFKRHGLLLNEDWEFASGSLMTTDGKMVMDKIQTHVFYGDPTMKGDVPFILISTDKYKDFKMYNLNTRKLMTNDYQFKNEHNAYYSTDFTEGLLPVKQKGKWGFIDTAGKIKLPAIYENADNFHEGWAVVGKKSKGMEETYQVYINKTGKELPGIKADYLSASDFREGIAFYKKPYDAVKDFSDDAVYYFNNSGKVIFKSEGGDFFMHGNFSNGLAAVPNKEGKYGYINAKGQLVIPYQFSIPKTYKTVSAIAFDKSGYAIVEKDGKTITIDKTGK